MVLPMPKSKVANNLKVGDKIWYRRTDWPGSLYQHELIVGETSRSWLVLSANEGDSWMAKNPERYADKLPKTLAGFELGTELQAKRKQWANDNRYRISQLAYGPRDADTIIAIARILKYEVPEELNEGTQGSNQDSKTS